MKAAPSATGVVEGARAPRRWLDFSLGFVCVFGGLSLPLPMLGPLYVKAHAAIASLALPSSLASGVELSFPLTDLSEHPWSLTLLVTAVPPQAPVSVPIDLRALVYLPTICFVALTVATPLGSRRRMLSILGAGLMILEPLLLGLTILPVLSFLGGTGPVRAFELGLVTHAMLQIIYRALVASPGMAYAIPLFLWWVLVVKLGRRGEASDLQPLAPTRPSEVSE